MSRDTGQEGRRKTTVGGRWPHGLTADGLSSPIDRFDRHEAATAPSQRASHRAEAGESGAQPLVPQRFEELPPAIFLEHYVEERTPQGRLGRKATWDRLSFHSWAPRRVWLSGQERIAFGDPHWEHLPEHEVEALLGREEMRALPPQVPIANDQA